MMRGACGFHIGAVASLLALIVLGTAWELVLAPLRPGGSWMVLKVVPLLFPLLGVIKRDVYTMQWASMLILIYLTEGVVRAATEPGMSGMLALAETALVCTFFFCSLLYLRPYKRAAKELAKQTIDKAIQKASSK
jgi:uncharacterized membrane protein